tara:strand:+ start:7464 stop:7937 length:474 start_codon:yes stop_codon:yes gene_type:complete
MYIDLDKIDRNARCWVYALEKNCKNVNDDIHKFLKKICENWMTHSNSINASYKIYDNRYIILFAENNISGCSIDGANRLVREKLNELNIDIMPNSKIGIFNNEKLVYYDRLPLINKIKAKEVLKSDKMINTTIQSKAEFDKKWIVEINKSWLVNFIK